MNCLIRKQIFTYCYNKFITVNRMYFTKCSVIVNLIVTPCIFGRITSIYQQTNAHIISHKTLLTTSIYQPTNAHIISHKNF